MVKLTLNKIEKEKELRLSLKEDYGDIIIQAYEPGDSIPWTIGRITEKGILRLASCLPNDIGLQTEKSRIRVE